MFDIGKWGKAMRNDQEGFTLVELMVVVVIIAILVAIAIPIYNAITEGAEQSAVEANLRTIDSAVMQYKAMGEGMDDDVTLDDLEGEFLEELDAANTETYDVQNVGSEENPSYRGVLTGGSAGGIDEFDDGTYLGNLDWDADGGQAN